LVDVACERNSHQEREALGPLHKAPGPGKVLGSDSDQQDKIFVIKKERKKVYLSSSRTYIVIEITADTYIYIHG
jgi:hypothetical protein